MKQAAKAVLLGVKSSHKLDKNSPPRRESLAGAGARHVLVDYAEGDREAGQALVGRLEAEGWRVFDPSRGRRLDINAVISKGVAISDVAVLVVSPAFSNSKREMKLANFIAQKKLPLIYITAPEQGAEIPAGGLGIILADATAAPSAEGVSSLIASMVTNDIAEALKRLPNEIGHVLDKDADVFDDSIFAGSEVTASYSQFGAWHNVSFDYFSLSSNGEVIGQGDDGVGAFTISGSYTMPTVVAKGMFQRNKTVEGKINFTKSYIGQHDVLYDGTLKRTGTTLEMNGTWTIVGYDTKPFKMSLLASASLSNQKAVDVNGADITEVVYDCAPEDAALVDALAVVLNDKYSIRAANKSSDTIATKLQRIQTADALLVVLSEKFEQSTDAKKLLAYADKVGKPIIPIHTSSSYTQGKEVAVICAGLLYTIVNEKTLNQRAADVANQILKATTNRSTTAQKEELLVDSNNVRGWYEYQDGRHVMQFNSFRMTDSTISGEGGDFVGPFILSGTVNMGESTIEFDKQYLGQHIITYSGKFEHHSVGLRIIGVWSQKGYPSNNGNFGLEALQCTDQGTSKPRSHVFISYCWADQEYVKLIADELRRREIPLFFDISGDMANNINEAMADGVENAYTLLCFASKSYARSKNCKKELSYARQRGKKIAAVLLDDTERLSDKEAEWLANIIKTVDCNPAKPNAIELAEELLPRFTNVKVQGDSEPTTLELRTIRLTPIFSRRVFIEADNSFQTAGVDSRGPFTVLGQVARKGDELIVNASLEYIIDPAQGMTSETASVTLKVAAATLQVKDASKEVRTTAMRGPSQSNTQPISGLSELEVVTEIDWIDPCHVPANPNVVELKSEYHQRGWYPMRMEMFSMNKGIILAQGDDTVGSFTCAGAYNELDASGTADVAFVKQYIGAHSVRYAGKVRVEKSAGSRKVLIEGYWTIEGYESDQFRIECAVKSSD